MQTKQNRWYLLVPFLAIVAVGFIIGRYTTWGTDRKFISEEDCVKRYAFINTKVACGPEPVISKLGYAETQSEIRKYIDSKISEGVITEAGVYFRDLENGPVFGVNEDLNFSAASLLKLPLALAYLSSSLDEPKILDSTLSFKASALTVTQYYPSTETIQPNTQYTIREIIRRMLVYSDNNAYALLSDFLDKAGKSDLLQKTYVDLGLATPDTPFEDTMTVRRYGSIFRALYNVSYLDTDLDEDILHWLTEADFHEGIDKGVPDDIITANKFGERVGEDGKVKQLHDCGIVYYPGNPYLICVMSRGYEFDDLSNVIGHISGIVYKEVDSRRFK